MARSQDRDFFDECVDTLAAVSWAVAGGGNLEDRPPEIVAEAKRIAEGVVTDYLAQDSIFRLIMPATPVEGGHELTSTEFDRTETFKIVELSEDKEADGEA
jgi:hypothetical protein